MDPIFAEFIDKFIRLKSIVMEENWKRIRRTKKKKENEIFAYQINIVLSP